MLRSAASLALAFTLLSLAPAAATAQSRFGPTASLTDLRVGVHPDHTRIVIETDSAAPYVMEPSEGELLVRVDAAAAAEAVTARSPHLVWVKVEPTTSGTDIRIQLKQPVDVKPLVLSRPDRIVLDLYAREEAAEAEPLPAPELLPEEEQPPEVVAGEPEEMAEPELAFEEEPGLPEEEPALAEPEAEEPLVLELPEAEAGEGEGEAATAEDVASAEPEIEIAEQEEPVVAPTPAEASEPLAPAEQARTPGAETTPGAPAASRRPYLFGATAVVLLAIFVWLRRRLRTSEPSRLPPLPEEDESAPFATPERAVSIGDEPDGGESVFDVEPDSLEPEPAEVPSLRTPLPDLEPDDERDRRIAHLEKRIEELAEARDRLERQIAAQTEELRVQRAAIARTQRVLRSIAPKGDEEPSEPLVRG